MQTWLVIALCSFFLFGAACGTQENTAPPESSSEIQIQEIEGPGILPHFDGPETLRSPGAVDIEKKKDLPAEEP